MKALIRSGDKVVEIRHYDDSELPDLLEELRKTSNLKIKEKRLKRKLAILFFFFVILQTLDIVATGMAFTAGFGEAEANPLAAVAMQYGLLWLLKATAVVAVGALLYAFWRMDKVKYGMWALYVGNAICFCAVATNLIALRMVNVL